MKYRVKFQCYHYNTGSADNGSYYATEDFDELNDAIDYRNRVNEQLVMTNDWDANRISFDKFQEWKKHFDFIEVENGYISGYASIVKYFPEREEPL